MLGFSNEKIKCSKYFIVLVTMATKVGGVARFEKKILFFSIFELLQPFPQRT